MYLNSLHHRKARIDDVQAHLVFLHRTADVVFHLCELDQLRNLLRWNYA